MATTNPVRSRLRNRITVQKTTTSRGAAGSVQDTWATFITRSAEIRYLTGREYHGQQQEQNEYTVRFIVRYDSLTKLINTKDYQITYNGNTYDISSVTNIKEMNRQIEILASLHNG